MNARRMRRQVLSVLLLGGLGGGCAAIVDFPDQTLADERDGSADAAVTPDATSDGHAPTGDATTGDAASDAPDDAASADGGVDGSDGGSFCSAYPRAAFCDDFEGSSLSDKGWKPSITVDGGSASVTEVDGSAPGNHALTVLLPGTAAYGDVDEQQQHTAIDGSSGVLRIAFDLMMSQVVPPSQLIYAAEIDQNDHELKVYLYTSNDGFSDYVKVTFQERSDDGGTTDWAYGSGVDLTSWTRVEFVVTAMGGSSTFTATIAGDTVGAGVMNLSGDWTTQPLNFRLGDSYIEGSGAKTLFFDNVLTDTQ